MSGLQYPGDGCNGAWQPQDFGIYLERVSTWQKNQGRLDYNEVRVVLPRVGSRAGVPSSQRPHAV